MKHQNEKDPAAPLVGCQAKPVSDALTGRETLNLNGSMGRKVRDGKYRVLDIPEGSAGAGGVDAKEGAILRSEKNAVQDVVCAESQHKAIGDKDRKGWSDWDGRKSPEDRRRVGGAGVPLGERVHVGGGEHGGIFLGLFEMRENGTELRLGMESSSERVIA